MKKFLRRKEFPILVVVIILVVIISVGNSVFYRIDNIFDILKSSSVLGILACAMLLVIISGGIDVSVGAIVAASSCFLGSVLSSETGNIFLALVLCIAAGGAMGLINGLLIAKLKIPAIVATLGTVTVINGLMMYITNGSWMTIKSEGFIAFGKFKIFEIALTDGGLTGFPIQLLLMIGIAALTWFILKYTSFGRGVYAIGGNVVSAERIGYNVSRIQIMIYSYLGLISGFAAFVHTSIMKQVDPNAFSGYELQVIAAVVLGGANITGGYGSIAGSLLGVLMLGILNNGLTLLKIPTYWQSIVMGIIILIAVSIDVIQRNRNEKLRARVDVE